MLLAAIFLAAETSSVHEAATQQQARSSRAATAVVDASSACCSNMQQAEGAENARQTADFAATRLRKADAGLAKQHETTEDGSFQQIVQ